MRQGFKVAGISRTTYLINSIATQKRIFGKYWGKPGWLDTSRKLFVTHEIQEAIGKLVKGESISIVVADPKTDNILELKRTISYP